MEIINDLNIAGLILTLLFETLILSKKNKTTQDFILAFFILLLGTFLLIKYIVQNDLTESYLIVTYLDIYYWVLLGPTLYIYTLVSTKEEKILQKKYLYVLIPALIVTICFSGYLFHDPKLFFDEEEKLTLKVTIGYYIWLYNSVIFYVLTIIRLKQHQKNIQYYYSYSRTVDYKWLYYLSNGFAIYLLFLIVRAMSKNVFDLELPFDSYAISIIVMILYIFGIGYFGYKQKGIFNNDISNLNPANLSFVEEENNKNGRQYEKSGLNKKEAKLILDRLEKLMQTEKPYLDNELDLATLAGLIPVSPHKLSQVLNVYLNKNFFDYINSYRMEKVKEYLIDSGHNHYKIESLAYESGFCSKSTFYKFFKRKEGITPAEFRLKYQKEMA